MAGLLDSLRNFGSNKSAGGSSAQGNRLNQLDAMYGTSVLGFLDKAGTPPPIIPTGMQDSSQIMAQTNAAAGVQDASRGLSGGLPSLQTPQIRSSLSQLDPRRGMLDEETEEERFMREQMQILEQGYGDLTGANQNPYSATPYSNFGFDQYNGQN